MSKENYKEKNKKINSEQFMQENTAFLDNKEELNMLHSRELKKKICENICINYFSTLKTANEYNIPIKILEKWITSYNKNPHCFDHVTEIVYDFNPVNNDNDINYDDLNKDELKNIIMKKDIEIARLKKAYTVKGGGTKKKVFVTFSKKNMK